MSIEKVNFEQQLKEAMIKRDLAELKRMMDLHQDSLDVNQQYGVYGITLLHHACTLVALEVVDFLIKQGADVNIQTRMGRSALHLASCKEQPLVLKALLAAGANVYLKDQEGDVALHDAASRKCPENTKVLLEHYEDIFIPNRHGRNALQMIHYVGDLRLEREVKALFMAETERRTLSVTVDQAMQDSAESNLESIKDTSSQSEKPRHRL